MILQECQSSIDMQLPDVHNWFPIIIIISKIFINKWIIQNYHECIYWPIHQNIIFFDKVNFYDYHYDMLP